MGRNTAKTLRGVALGMSMLALAGCMSMGPHIQGSGVSKTESRSVAAFSQIDASHAVQLDVTIGSPASVEVTTDDNLQQHVITEVVGERLKIRMDGGSITTKVGVHVRVTAPSLTALSCSGAVSAKLPQIDAANFDLDLSGASQCTMGAKSDSFQAKLSGASRATITGQSDRLKVNASGASSVKAGDMMARAVDADASGASTIEVQATDELTAEASGASNIRFSGSPAKVRKDASGASNITPR